MANYIQGYTSIYTTSGSYDKRIQLSPDSGSANAMPLLAKDANIYVEYSFPESNPRTVFGSCSVVVGDDSLYSDGNLSLVPVYNTQYGRCFCYISDMIKNWILRNWWTSGVEQKGGCEVSELESGSIFMDFSTEHDEADRQPEESGTSNVGYILHAKETENRYYICDSLTDTDSYIYAAIEYDGDEIPDCSVEFQKIG